MIYPIAYVPTIIAFHICSPDLFFVTGPAPVRALALAENGGHHIAYTKAAKVWLDKLAADSNFIIDYIDNTDKIDSAYLLKYTLFIQLDYPPYAWKPAAVKAFEQYMNEGRGGWIGFTMPLY